MSTNPISVQTNTSNLNGHSQSITIPANGIGNFLMVSFNSSFLNYRMRAVLIRLDLDCLLLLMFLNWASYEMKTF